MSTKSRPTQADVAREAGVSQATVSAVLNNRLERAIPITEETRKRVLEAVQKLGYHPDARAQSLSRGRSDVIGLLIPDNLNPFFWDFARGVEDVAYENQCSIILTSTGLNAEREAHCLRLLNQRQTDGLILLPIFRAQLLGELRAARDRGRPVVLYGTDMLEGVDVVLPDNYAGARALMAHLLALGHQRIAFIQAVATPELGTARLRAYRHALAEAGLPEDPALIYTCRPTFEDAHAATLHLLALPDPPTALFAINDYTATAALQAVYQKGLRVPDDISLVGYDDIEQSRHLWPPLTTVALDGAESGRIVTRLLFERLKRPSRPPQRIEVQCRLVIRSSTAPPAGRNR
ncbi:MAG: LacI family DNA-binding transcriptional regulator [Anaerolineae bacterium]